MKKFLVTTAALGAMLASATTATAGSLDDLSVSASVDYVSEYVFRGVSFANTAVQPGIEVGLGGFTVGAWASAALGDSSTLAGDEIDIYASYGWNLTDALSASVGATIFHFPESGSLFNFDSEELGSTFEAYASVAYDTVLSPSLTGYYDFTLDAVTLEGSLGHSFAVADKTSFDLGLTGGKVFAADGGVADGTADDSDYAWATASASLNYAFSDLASIYFGVNFTVNSDDNLDLLTAGDLDGLQNDIDAAIADLDEDDLADLAVFGLDGSVDAVSAARALGLSTTTDNTLFWVGTGFSTSF